MKLMMICIFYTFGDKLIKLRKPVLASESVIQYIRKSRKFFLAHVLFLIIIFVKILRLPRMTYILRHIYIIAKMQLFKKDIRILKNIFSFKAHLQGGTYEYLVIPYVQYLL